MMEGKQVAGDSGLSANLAGMTKNQLYDIMSQMKTLIDQNQQQARQILTQNPQLTKTLFQAQIMLGMLQPPQAISKIEPQASQKIQQPQPSPPQSNVQPPFMSGPAGIQEKPFPSQTQQAVIRKQPTQNKPAVPISSTSSLPAANVQPQPMPAHPQLRHNMPPTPVQLTSQPPPFRQPEMPVSSPHPQRPVHAGGLPHLGPQQPLPPQSRPSSMLGYHHQYAPPQTGPNVGFQQHGGPTPPPQHLSQPMYHSGARPSASSGLPFPPGQPRLPSQPPSQPMYQVGGAHFGGGDGDFNNQLQGVQPPALQSHAGPVGSQPRPASLTPDMEKALLQQVMSLTPDQINLLPPEQRNQVLQLQQALLRQ